MAAMPRERRQRDVFNESTPWLGTTPPFNEAFPTVAKLEVAVTEKSSAPGWLKDSAYGKHTAGDYVDCTNPACSDGGFRLGDILQMMTHARELEWSATESCQGHEGGPKGTSSYRPCDHWFEIAIEIAYKDADP